MKRDTLLIILTFVIAILSIAATTSLTNVTRTIQWNTNPGIDSVYIDTNSNFSTTGNIDIEGNLTVEGTHTNINSDSISFRNAVAQFHRNDSINTATINDWVDVKFDTLIDSETTYGYTFNADSTGFIASFTGITRVQDQTDDANIDFEGDAVFDNPVSFSINFEKISD